MSNTTQQDLDVIKSGVQSIGTGIDAMVAALAQAAQNGLTPEQATELHQAALDIQADVSKLPQQPTP